MTGARVLGLVDREWPALTTPPEAQEPIRAELFSVERLEQHAESLAAAQHVTAESSSGQRPGAARPRQRTGAARSRTACSPRRSARNGRSRRPRSGWSTTSTSSTSSCARSATICPSGFYRELPKLADGPLAGYPRVVRHWRGRSWRTPTAGSIPRSLRRFVRAYQRVAAAAPSASSGRSRSRCASCWSRISGASPSAIVRRARARQRGRRARRRAARRSAGESRPTRPPRWPASIAARCPQLRRAARAAPARAGSDRRSRACTGWTSASRRRVRPPTRSCIVEHERQAALNVTVRNVITSMRLMSALDWTEFFESVSLVDEVLRSGSQFAAMDFATRDRYRHAVEELARGSEHTELDVATARRRRRPAHASPSRTRRTIRSDGPGLLPDLAADVARSRRASASVRRLRRRFLRAYVAAGDRPATSARSRSSARWSSRSRSSLVHAGASDAVAGRVRARWRSSRASDLAIALINRGVIDACRPRRCRSWSCSAGVPADLRTMVVVPTLLTDAAEVSEQIERPRGALPRQRRRRDALRAALRLDRRAGGARARRTTSSSRRRATASRA